MPTFGQRPLSWLFVIATVCVDITLATSGSDPFDSLLARAALGFWIGQMFVLGGWLALGDPHRLLRAGVYVAAVLALTTLISVWLNEGRGLLIQEWGLMLTGVVLFSAVPAIVAGVTSFLGAAIRGNRGPEAPLRFPVVELLGWMIVVAVASAALRFADFSGLAGPRSGWMISGGSAVLAGLICAILNRRNATTLLANLTVSVALVTTFVIGAHTLRPDDDVRVILPLAYVYLAAWLGAGWLDRHAIDIRPQRGVDPSGDSEGSEAAGAAGLRVVSAVEDDVAG